MTASASHRIAATLALGAHRAAVLLERPPQRERQARRSRRPGGRRGATWRIAYPSAPSPVPGVSGLMPHTIGPPTIAAPRSDVGREVRPHHVGGDAPAPAEHRRHPGEASPQRRRGSARERSAARSATSRIIRTAGSACRRYRRYPSRSPGAADARWSRVRSASCHVMSGFTAAGRRSTPPRRRPGRCRCTRDRGARGRARPITGVVRNVTWSQLQTLTIAPANASLAAVPPTSARASSSSVDRPGPGEIGGGHQPVVPGTDDDGVDVVVRRLACAPLCPLGVGASPIRRYRCRSVTLRSRPPARATCVPPERAERAVRAQHRRAAARRHRAARPAPAAAHRPARRRRAWPTAAVDRVGDELDVWLLPPLAYTKSNEHAWSPGTFWLSAETLLAVLDDIGRCVAMTPARRLVFLNGHGGNSALVGVANRELRLRHGLMTFLAHPGVPPDQGGPSAADELGHGRARRHRRDVARCCTSRPSSSTCRRPRAQRARAPRRQPLRALRRHGVVRVAVERLRRQTAYIGDPTGATAERGAELFDGGGRPRSARRWREIAAFEFAALTMSPDDLRIDGDRLWARLAGARRDRRDRGPERRARLRPPRAHRRRPRRARPRGRRGCATSAST